MHCNEMGEVKLWLIFCLRKNLKSKYGKTLMAIKSEWQEYGCLLDYFCIFYIFKLFKEKIVKIQMLNLEVLH